MLRQVAVMKSLTFFLAMLGSAACVSSTAFGWAGGGHKIIALMAWEQLSPAARSKAVSLLENHPEFANHFQVPMEKEIGASPQTEQRQRWCFAQAAIWPDLVRPPMDGSPNPNEKHHHAPWHYLDLPIFADDEARTKLSGTLPKLYWKWKPGLPEFIEQRLTAAQAVDKGYQIVPDPGKSKAEQAIMLCWLFHVTGDLHQPCHCSALFSVNQFPKGDRGGNSVLLKDAPGDNLHAYWDNLLGDPGSSFADAEKSSREILVDKALMQKAAQSSATLDPEDWIKEGAAVAKDAVYPPVLVQEVLKTQPHSYVKNNVTYSAVGPIDLGGAEFKKYDSHAHEVARLQAAIAAMRLAKALEKVVGN